jgi:GNAT superfamily N-acetyltransferase
MKTCAAEAPYHPLRAHIVFRTVSSQSECRETTEVEIPRCESCGRIAQYRCAVDQNYVCAECARYVPVSRLHVPAREKPPLKLKVVEKMRQDSSERTAFESLEDMTGWPPPEKLGLLESGWKPSPGYVYGHEDYKVWTIAAYAGDEPAGYLDFLYTMDPEEEMSIQFWEMAIHPKYQGMGVFSAMISKLKEIAKDKGVKRLYVSNENDNLPAVVANYMLGGKVLYARDTKEQTKARFGIWRRNDLVFQFE